MPHVTLYHHIKNNFIYLRSSFKKIPARKIPTSGVDAPDPPRVLSFIQPETIIVVNIRSKKHPVSRKECKVIECAGIPVKWTRVRIV